MRYFFGVRYEKYCKNIVWIYLLIGVLFFYGEEKRQIPDHIYINEGEDIQSEFAQNISVNLSNESKETLAEVRPFMNEMERTDSGVGGRKLCAKSDCCVNCFLFGIIPMKSVDVSVVNRQKVYVSGRLIGIYEKADGVLVLDTEMICDQKGNEVSPAKNKIAAGDYIVSINGTCINTKTKMLELMSSLDGERVNVDFIRNNKLMHTEIKPVLTESGKYMLGIWIKDDMAGIGTMTYYTKEGEFGALGHGIGDGTTGELLSVADGAIYDMELTGITKGKAGVPGELSGTVYYGKRNHLGTLQENDSLGIYGMLDPEEMEEYVKTDGMYPICYKQDIDLRDENTYILSDVSGQIEKYQVTIQNVDMNAADSNKGIVLKVTDPRLIELTGGIVQGLSGSPIIQNGKIIGAVTHVLVNDPTKGYGIFIETMLGN